MTSEISCGMKTSRVVVVVVAFVAPLVRARSWGESGPTFRNVGQSEDMKKLEAQINAIKEARERGEPDPDVMSMPPPSNGQDGGSIAAVEEPPLDIDHEEPKPAGGSVLRALTHGLVGRVKAPMAATVVIATATFGYKSIVARRAAARALEVAGRELEAALTALSDACGTKRVETPEHDASTVDGMRSAARELDCRRELITQHVLPLLGQLEQSTPVAAQLATKPSAELAALNVTLTARVDACGTLLAECEALGQPARVRRPG